MMRDGPGRMPVQPYSAETPLQDYPRIIFSSSTMNCPSTLLNGKLDATGTAFWQIEGSSSLLVQADLSR
jgi:hypothetical protein